MVQFDTEPFICRGSAMTLKKAPLVSELHGPLAKTSDLIEGAVGSGVLSFAQAAPVRVPFLAFVLLQSATRNVSGASTVSAGTTPCGPPIVAPEISTVVRNEIA